MIIYQNIKSSIEFQVESTCNSYQYVATDILELFFMTKQRQDIYTDKVYKTKYNAIASYIHQN